MTHPQRSARYNNVMLAWGVLSCLNFTFHLATPISVGFVTNWECAGSKHLFFRSSPIKVVIFCFYLPYNIQNFCRGYGESGVSCYFPPTISHNNFPHFYTRGILNRLVSENDAARVFISTKGDKTIRLNTIFHLSKERIMQQAQP